eukprot:7351684-Pyramimonas_sp.AAC.1
MKRHAKETKLLAEMARAQGDVHTLGRLVVANFAAALQGGLLTSPLAEQVPVSLRRLFRGPAHRPASQRRSLRQPPSRTTYCRSSREP